MLSPSRSKITANVIRGFRKHGKLGVTGGCERPRKETATRTEWMLQWTMRADEGDDTRETVEFSGTRPSNVSIDLLHRLEASSVIEEGNIHVHNVVDKVDDRWSTNERSEMDRGGVQAGANDKSTTFWESVVIG